MLTKIVKQQQTLLTIWSEEDKEDSVKRRREDSDTVEGLGLVQAPADDFLGDRVSEVSEDDEADIPGDDSSCVETEGEEANLPDEMEEIDDASYGETGDSEAVPISSHSTTVETVLAPVCASVCTGQCCASDEIAFQP